MSDNQMFPIVLAHGIARFDILLEIQRRKFNLPENRLDDEFQYFKNIKTHLESNGFEPVFHTNQNFAGSVDFRAAQLRNEINEITAQTRADKVHIIAHSMGGLDARRMIVDLRAADRVASLTTIGTPHLGTILADHLIGNGGMFLIEILKKVTKLDLDGFKDLTISACEQFNRRAEEQEALNDVFYQTYSSFEDISRVFTPLIPSWTYIRSIEGRNDGLVPVSSQQWKRELIAADGTRKPVTQKEFPLPADHLNQVGWWDLEEAINPVFGVNYLQQKIEYENKIKDIYLEIARNLWQM